VLTEDNPTMAVLAAGLGVAAASALAG